MKTKLELSIDFLDSFIKLEKKIQIKVNQSIKMDKIPIVRNIKNPDALNKVKELFDFNAYTYLEFLVIREKMIYTDLKKHSLPIFYQVTETHLKTHKDIKAFFVICFIICTTNVYSQVGNKWYDNLSQKAEWVNNSTLMKIGDKTYHVYNAFDPIAPKGDECVIDYAGTLNYYMWLFNIKNGFVTAMIDMELTIFYFDKETENYTSPNRDVFEEL